MITLRFRQDDPKLRRATLQAANNMGLTVRIQDDAPNRFDIDLDDAEQAYRLGSGTAMIAVQDVMRSMPGPTPAPPSDQVKP